MLFTGWWSRREICLRQNRRICPRCGYGTTHYLSSDTVRNGQQSVIAADILALMDALHIERAILGGFDWGARTANVIAALWPERCKTMVSVSGYLTGSQAANRQPLPPQAELAWWYQFYFATERGKRGYEPYRYDCNKLIWQLASPPSDGRSASRFITESPPGSVLYAGAKWVTPVLPLTAEQR